MLMVMDDVEGFEYAYINSGHGWQTHLLMGQNWQQTKKEAFSEQNTTLNTYWKSKSSILLH